MDDFPFGNLAKPKTRQFIASSGILINFIIAKRNCQLFTRARFGKSYNVFGKKTEKLSIFTLTASKTGRFRSAFLFRVPASVCVVNRNRNACSTAICLQEKLYKCFRPASQYIKSPKTLFYPHSVTECYCC